MIDETKLTIDLINKLNTPNLIGENFRILNAIASNSEQGIDIKAEADINGEPKTLYFEVAGTEMTSLLREKMKMVKELAEQDKAVPFIAGQFFGNTDRELAEKEGVGLFDLTGNVFLNIPGFHYERVIQKNPYAQESKLKNLFAPVSSRITRVLLINPKKVWSLEDLAHEASVSIGLAYKVIQRMIENEIIGRGEDKKIKLNNPGKLLDEWRAVQNSYKNQRFNFYSFKKDSIFQILRELGKSKNYPRYGLAFFTGASLIAPFLTSFPVIQMYIDNVADIARWKEILDLKEAEVGQNIELYIPYDQGVFYGMQKIDPDPNRGSGKINVTSNIQLYVDLYNNPARGMEQAEHLREVKIKF